MRRRGPTDSAGFLLWHLTLRWREALNRALSPFGLTHTNYVVLASLFWLTTVGDPPSQRRIADHCGLEPMNISKAVRALEAAGLLTRMPDRTDGRAFGLRLTARGNRAFREAARVLERVEATFLASLGERAEAFKEQLRVVLRAVGAPSTIARATPVMEDHE
jgi:DNA-binding MarR family transcriptional regulator